MDYNTPKALLKKYFDGHSSLQEEEELREFFSSTSEIPNELIQAKAVFNYFKDSRNIQFPEPESKKKQFTIPRIPAIAATAVIFIGISLLAMKLTTGTLHPAIFNKTIVAMNDDLAVKKVLLPDNNMVWLNKNSGVRYPKRLRKKNNAVSVYGEVYFELLGKTQPAYYVLAENAYIKPESGSAFNIQADPNKESIEVCVETGAITVSEKGDRNGLALLVTAGNYCSVHKNQKLLFAATNTNSNYLSWKTGTLFFKDTHLATVRDALAKYYDVQIELKEKSLAYCRFSGEFKEKPLIDILNQIRSEFKFDIHFREDIITLSGKGCLP